MKRVIVLGATGMIGRAVTNALLKKTDKYAITISARPQTVFKDGKSVAQHGGSVVISKDFASMFNLSDFNNVIAYDATDLDLGKLWKAEEPPDYAINCIEAGEHLLTEDNIHKYQSIYVNSVLPHYLSGYAEKTGVKLIHVATNKVFSGNEGDYSESAVHDASSIYANSKSLGEPVNCMVLRASLIGEEINKNKGLLELIKSKSNQSIEAYTNHYWNGMTALRFGEICEEIISEEFFENGLFHLHTHQRLTDYDLASLINDKLKVNAQVVAVEDEKEVDRTLSSSKILNTRLSTQGIAEQLELIYSEND